MSYSTVQYMVLARIISMTQDEANTYGLEGTKLLDSTLLPFSKNAQINIFWCWQVEQ